MEEVKVMVADESHIKYIDTILTTIAEAAKKRGSGIAKRSQLHRNMGQQALCHHIRFDRSPRLPWFGIG